MTGYSEQALLDFAEQYPIGTEVRYQRINDGESKTTKIASEPYYLWCGQMAVKIEGQVWAANAKNIKPIEESVG